ncbi:MAG: class I SAM-dependent rRNA methyltransferase [Spirochaetales bacterium]|nr:class I SAM-dependent rRNA methyltransferase [Spirochaetales bacterium]
MSRNASVYLKPKRDTAIRAGHPWVFSGAVDRAENARAGDIVTVIDATGSALGIGTYHPGNTIRVRMIGDDPGTVVDASFFAARLGELVTRKQRFLPEGTDGFRIANADNDYLPGLIVDKYASCVVFQIHTAGMERLKEAVIEGIEALEPGIIVERSDVEARRADGLSPLAPRTVKGAIGGPVEFREAGVRLLADPLTGQKTGFYLDQREARLLVRSLAHGRRVVNLFSYTGGTSICAALAGAREVLSVDTSKTALTLAGEMFRLNHLDPPDGRYSFVERDVFDFLEEGNRGKSASARRDAPLLLVCDPPPFAKHRTALDAAKNEYLRLNRLCFQLLEPGDLFLTSSCSGLIDRESFSLILRHAAGLAHRNAVILKELGAPPDHTKNLAFPEGSYLKTLLLGVT